jgi:hypothetical protein
MASRPARGGASAPFTIAPWLALFAALAIGSAPVWAMLAGGGGGGQ